MQYIYGIFELGPDTLYNKYLTNSLTEEESAHIASHPQIKYWFGRLRRPFPKGESNLRNFQIFIKISKKDLWPSVFLKSLTFNTILKKSC